MNYGEALDWLYGTQQFGIKLGLEAPKRLLAEFLAFPTRETKVIHVAGTNGKGSTCAMMEALARATGRRTGLFTSPHLVDFCERAQINRRSIPAEKAALLLTQLKDLVAGWETHPTFFEITLALAMRHFRDEGCDLIILETGMGGRLDATTAVPADVCVLTPIGMDHTKWLGETLGEIAAEKVAIACRAKPLISAGQELEARVVIESHANEKRAPLTFVTEPLLGYPIALAGSHQKLNAALATEALHALGMPLTYDTVMAGLSGVSWPGRFEIFDLPGRAGRLVLDAAHNPHAAGSLAATFQDEFPGERANLIFGAVEDKDVAAILEILAPLVDELHLVPVNSARGVPPGELAKLPGLPVVKVYEDLPTALESTALDERPTVVTGSLFLVGEAYGLLQGCSASRASAQ